MSGSEGLDRDSPRSAEAEYGNGPRPIIPLNEVLDSLTSRRLRREVGTREISFNIRGDANMRYRRRCNRKSSRVI